MKKLLFGLVAAALICSTWIFISSNESIPTQETGGPKKGPRWFEHIQQIKGTAPAGAYLSWYRSTAFMKTGPAILDSMSEMGPFNVGGRTRAVLIDKADINHIVAGGISGGIWNSYDRGQSWEKVNDHEVNLNVSCITQSPFDTDIIYYGTGEGAGNSSGAPGAGIFKSTDGGKSFTLLPASTGGTFDYTWRIRHSKLDSNTFYVSTNSSGLYRSTDGGLSFERVFITGRPIHDLEILDDSTIIATVQGHGIFWSKTGDLGSFVAYSGLPGTNTFGRVELAYCEMNQDVMYAAYSTSANTDLLNIYKTQDRGQSWNPITRNPNKDGIRFPFTWYCLALQVKYNNPEVLMIGSVNMAFSEDGGNSWEEGQNTHADYHVMEVHESAKDAIFVGNDGGIYEYDWTHPKHSAINLNKGFNITQFYTGTYAPEGITISGGTQDNGTHYSIDHQDSFSKLYGGDGSYTHIHQQQPNVAYFSTQNGKLRKTLNFRTSKPISGPILTGLDDNGDEEIDDGAWFIHPFEMNYLDGDQLFFPAKNRLFRSSDGGELWFPVTNAINSGTARQAYIVGLSDQLNPVVFVGGSYGLLYRIRNAKYAQPGDETDLRNTIPLAVRADFIGAIKVNPVNPDMVYVGFTNYSSNARIWRMTGALTDTPTWTDISGNLPTNLPVNWIEADPASPDSVIFAATDFGLYYTNDGGQSWHKDEIVPNATVHMLRLRHSDRRLFIYTHGRGAFTAKVLPEGKEIAPHNQVNIAEISKGSLDFYPNPAQDKINFSGGPVGNLRVEVIDIKGRVLQTKTIRNSESMDVSALAEGVHFIRINQNGNISVRKLLKTK